MRSFVTLSLLFALAACVAPEEAPSPRSAVAAKPYQPVTSSNAFEDAPRPNRKVNNTNDSVIRLAR